MVKVILEQTPDGNEAEKLTYGQAKQGSAGEMSLLLNHEARMGHLV